MQPAMFTSVTHQLTRQPSFREELLYMDAITTSSINTAWLRDVYSTFQSVHFDLQNLTHQAVFEHIETLRFQIGLMEAVSLSHIQRITASYYSVVSQRVKNVILLTKRIKI
jgi:hypothetical protein